RRQLLHLRPGIQSFGGREQVAQYVVHEEIDAGGSACPGPLMELIRALRAADVGQVIALLSSYLGSAADIHEWVEKAGHKVLAVEEEEGVTRFIVEKARWRRSGSVNDVLIVGGGVGGSVTANLLAEELAAETAAGRVRVRMITDKPDHV